jgi:hypothetical protein
MIGDVTARAGVTLAGVSKFLRRRIGRGAGAQGPPPAGVSEVESASSGAVDDDGTIPDAGPGGGVRCDLAAVSRSVMKISHGRGPCDVSRHCCGRWVNRVTILSLSAIAWRVTHSHRPPHHAHASARTPPRDSPRPLRVNLFAVAIMVQQHRPDRFDKRASCVESPQGFSLRLCVVCSASAFARLCVVCSASRLRPPAPQIPVQPLGCEGRGCGP